MTFTPHKSQQSQGTEETGGAQPPSRPPGFARSATAGVVVAEEGTQIGAFSKAISVAGRLATPVGLAALPVWEAYTDGKHAYEEGKTGGEIALSSAAGVIKGAADTALPEIRSAVTGAYGGQGKELTGWDKALNAASDVTQSSFALAAGATAVGVVTGPGDIAPATWALGSGVANVAINTVKAVRVATGYAGKDQAPGYVYNGVAAGIHYVKAGFENVAHLFSTPQTIDPHTAPHEVPAQPSTPSTHPEGAAVILSR